MLFHGIIESIEIPDHLSRFPPFDRPAEDISTARGGKAAWKSAISRPGTDILLFRPGTSSFCTMYAVARSGRFSAQWAILYNRHDEGDIIWPLTALLRNNKALSSPGIGEQA